MSSAAVDVNTRRGQAWGAFRDMKKIRHNKEISTDLKAQIFQTTCLFILLQWLRGMGDTRQEETRLPEASLLQKHSPDNGDDRDRDCTSRSGSRWLETTGSGTQLTECV